MFSGVPLCPLETDRSKRHMNLNEHATKIESAILSVREDAMVSRSRVIQHALTDHSRRQDDYGGSGGQGVHQGVHELDY